MIIGKRPLEQRSQIEEPFDFSGRILSALAEKADHNGFITIKLARYVLGTRYCMKKAEIRRVLHILHERGKIRVNTRGVWL